MASAFLFLFFLSLPPFNAFPSRPPPTCYVGEGTGWVEGEGDMVRCEGGESASFCFIISLAKVHPLFFSPVGSATRSPLAYIHRHS
jgi:hypothetical protein